MNSIFRKPPTHLEPFDDRIDILFRELELAIKWQRPSILLAIYNSEIVLADAAAALENKMYRLGQNVHRINIKDVSHPDISQKLSSSYVSENSIIFLDGLRWGTSKDGLNVYSALNIRREYFVENCIRLVFWLNEIEAVDLARFAPDYWAFRHRVVEFLDAPKPEQIVHHTLESVWQNADGEIESNGELPADSTLRETLLADMPENPEPSAIYGNMLLTLGILHWRKNNPKKALELIETSQEISRIIDDPGLEAQCLNAMALIKTGSGKIEEAVAAYEQALDLDPDQKFPWTNLGNLYSKLELFDQAITAFKKGIEQNPEDAVAWNGLGDIFHKLGQTDNAIATYQKAIELAPVYVYPWNGLGNVLAGEGNIEKAIFAYQKAAEFDQPFTDPWVNLGKIYMNQNCNKNAIEALQKAIQIDPRNPEIWNELGIAYLASGDADKALAAYKQAIEMDLGRGEFYKNLAQAYFCKGEFEEAIELFQQSIRKFFDHTDKASSWNKLGETYRQINDYERAVAAYQQADLLTNDSSLYNEAEALPIDDRKEMIEQTENTILSEISVDPQDAEAKTDLAIENDNEVRDPDVSTHSDERASWKRELENIKAGLIHMEYSIAPYQREAGSFVHRESNSSIHFLDEVELPTESITEDIACSSSIDDQCENACDWNEQGNIYLDQGAYNEAIRAYMRAIEISPTFSWPYIKNLALANYRKGKNKGSITQALLNAQQCDETPETVEETQPASMHESLEITAGLTYSQEPVSVEESLEVFAAKAYKAFEQNARAGSGKQTKIQSKRWLKAENSSKNVLPFDRLNPVDEPVESKLPPREMARWKRELDRMCALNSAIVPEDLIMEAVLEDPRFASERLSRVDITAQELDKNPIQVHPEELLIGDKPSAESKRKTRKIHNEYGSKDAYEWNDLGNLYLKAGAFDDAIEAFNMSIELSPKFGLAYSNLALAYHHKGEYSESVPLYQKSIELFKDEKDRSTAWNRLGDTYRRLKQHNMAMEAYQKAKDSNPEPNTLVSRARLSLLSNSQG